MKHVERWGLEICLQAYVTDLLEFHVLYLVILVKWERKKIHMAGFCSQHLKGRVDSLEKTLMLGGIGGKRRRGQQRMRYLDGIIDSWA